MPAAFDACVRGGGRVRTKSLKDGKYIHICFPKGGGPSVAGEVKQSAQKAIEQGPSAGRSGHSGSGSPDER